MKILFIGVNGMVGKNIIEYDKVNFYEIFVLKCFELDLFDECVVDEYLCINLLDVVVYVVGIVGGI